VSAGSGSAGSGSAGSGSAGRGTAGTTSVGVVITSGTFKLDGGSWEVTNNIWLVGNDEEVLVIDAAHDAGAICAAVADRSVRAVVLTHGHNDHINVAIELRERLGAPVLMHPGDAPLWDMVHAGYRPDGELAHGMELEVGDATLRVLHTPGHSPGSCCLLWDSPGKGPVLFSGDTLFQGGPGATGRSYSDQPTIMASIRQHLMVLPAHTTVHTGHGPDTTIGAEAPGLAPRPAGR
jgi:glyoxylase-like metal-dependent hydrolase (beta-lactamase superfamily II)